MPGRARLAPIRAVKRLWDRLRSGYWLVPLSCVSIAVTVAFALIALDRYLQDRNALRWTYAGGPQNASDTLTTIASSMITFTGLVFSITVLALQLTSSQFSPRALRNFLRDRVAQFSLGLFIATFAYAFAALSAVRVASDDDPSFVPAVTVTGAFALIAASLVMFVQYIHHTAQSIRAVTIIERIADETRAAVDQTYPDPLGCIDGATHELTHTTGHAHLLHATAAGVIVDVDLDSLATDACAQSAVVEVLHHVGSYVCQGQPMMCVWTDAERSDELAAMQRFVALDRERTMRNDAAFGLRQLVDIAERALSPGVNDPTTAVQCLDRIHDILRRLIRREIPTMRTASRDGVVRAAVPSPSFDDLLALATEEIAHWGRDSLQIQRRLRDLFDDLADATDDPTRTWLLRRRAATMPRIRTPISDEFKDQRGND